MRSFYYTYIRVRHLNNNHFLQIKLHYDLTTGAFPRILHQTGTFIAICFLLIRHQKHHNKQFVVQLPNKYIMQSQSHLIKAVLFILTILLHHANVKLSLLMHDIVLLAFVHRWRCNTYGDSPLILLFYMIVISTSRVSAIFCVVDSRPVSETAMK